MKILISNDDGYLAPGLVALADAMSSLGEVIVVAPDGNRSGASSALTLDRPLSVQQAPNGYYFVNGTPSDCVHIALTALMRDKPDLVVSGINQGQNMGDDTLYSGTVAAAMEAFLFGLPAIAFSQVEKGWDCLADAARIAKEITQKIVRTHVGNPAQPFLWNVNIPNVPYSTLKGIKGTRLGRRHASEPVIKAQDPQGRDIYWIGPPGAARDAGEGTDFFAAQQGFVSVTPLQVDLTDLPQIQRLNSEWV